MSKIYFFNFDNLTCLACLLGFSKVEVKNLTEYVDLKKGLVLSLVQKIDEQSSRGEICVANFKPLQMVQV